MRSMKEQIRCWMRPYWVVAGMLILEFGQLGAQNVLINRRSLTKEDGLASYLIEALAQDQQGFIWIASNEGVQRFDGYTFKLFNNQTHPLIRSDYNRLMVAPNGHLWMIAHGTMWRDSVLVWSGLQVVVLDPLAEKAVNIEDYFNQSLPFRLAEVIHMAQEPRTRTIYVTTRNGQVFQYQKRWAKAAKFVGPLGGVFPVGRDQFWVLGPRRLHLITTQGQVLEQDSLRFQPELVQHHADQIFLQNSTGLGPFHYKRKGAPLDSLERPTRQLLTSRPLLGAFFSRQGVLHFFDETDFYTRNQETNRYAAIPWAARRGLPERLPVMFFDAKDQLWCANQTELNVLAIKPNVFERFLDSTYYGPRGLLRTDNFILVNTYKGLISISTEMERYGTVRKWADFSAKGAWSEPGLAWMAGPANKIHRIDLQSGDHQQLILPVPTGKEPFIQSVCLRRDRLGRLWVGTNIGLLIYHEKEQRWEWPRLQSLQGIPINCLYENREGMWVGAKTGLYQVRLNGYGVSRRTEIGYADVTYLYESKEGPWWIATAKGGLIRWDRSRGSTRRFTNLDGLSSNTIYAILPDGNGSLWLPSSYGLMRLDLPSHLVTTFFQADGLPGDAFNQWSAFLDPQGRMLLGGPDGLVQFAPRWIRKQMRQSNQQVVFTKVEKLNKYTGELSDITPIFQAQRTLVLLPENSYLSIAVSALEYVNTRTISYAYRIQGLQKEWTYFRDNHFRLGGLPPGNYQLEVKAQGAFGQWTKPLTIPLAVKAPYYRTWWFWAGLAGLLGLLAYAAGHFRIRQLQDQTKWLDAEVARRTAKIENDKALIASQKEELERINALKDRIFMIIGHELRGPAISLSSLTDTVAFLMQKGSVERAVKLTKDVDRTAKGLKVLIDNLLSWGRSQTEHLLLLPEKFSLLEVAQEAVTFFALSVEEKKLEVALNIPPDSCLYLDKNAFRIVFINILSNAIKFTRPNGRIAVIGESIGEGKVRIKIADTGIGIPAERLPRLFDGEVSSVPGTKGERGVGIGLAVSRELLYLNQGEISVVSKENEGTIFTIILPSCGAN